MTRKELAEVLRRYEDEYLNWGDCGESSHLKQLDGKRAAAAFRAGAEALERSTWQPIATAPKAHCVQILMRDSYGCMYVGYYDKYLSGWCNFPSATALPCVAHWMPLPALPEVEG